MNTSILTSIKKILGLGSDYTAFDPDVIMHINSVFADLHLMGIGPSAGFAIEDATPVWADFLAGDVTLNAVKTYVYLRVRLLFDPPTSSYMIDAMKEQITKFEWRLNVVREGVAWTDPNPPVVSEP